MTVARKGPGLVALAAFACACGETEQDQPPPWKPPDVELGDQAQVAGQRLRPLVWLADGQPPIRTARFRDTERDEVCSFQLADDGSYRCFPLDVAGGYSVDWLFGEDSLLGGGPLFADASCQERAYLAGAADVRYVAATREDGCGSGTRLYELGAELGADPYFGPDCAGQVLKLEHVFRRGPRIPNDAFVRAGEVTTSAEDGLIAGRQLSAEDGSGFLLGFFDRERGARCEAFELASGLRCVTSPVYTQSMWPGELVVDGQECWNLVIETDPCLPPRSGLTRQGDTLHANQLIPAAQVTDPSNALATCLDIAESAYVAATYAVTDEIAAESLPEITLATVSGTRLSDEWLQSPAGGVVLPQDESSMLLDDDELGVRCAVKLAADGQMRCLPGSGSARYFADSACIQPLFTPSDPPPAFFSHRSRDLTHVYEVGEAYSGETFEASSSDDSTCTPAVTDQALTRPGPEISPEMFVAYVLTEL